MRSFAEFSERHYVEVGWGEGPLHVNNYLKGRKCKGGIKSLISKGRKVMEFLRHFC